MKHIFGFLMFFSLLFNISSCRPPIRSINPTPIIIIVTATPQPISTKPEPGPIVPSLTRLPWTATSTPQPVETTQEPTHILPSPTHVSTTAVPALLLPIDANEDGVINSKDILPIDVNKDGVVDMKDGWLLMDEANNFFEKKIKPFFDKAGIETDEKGNVITVDAKTRLKTKLTAEERARLTVAIDDYNIIYSQVMATMNYALQHQK
jgi:hypothetical protein